MVRRTVARLVLFSGPCAFCFYPLIRTDHPDYAERRPAFPRILPNDYVLKAAKKAVQAVPLCSNQTVTSVICLIFKCLSRIRKPKKNRQAPVRAFANATADSEVARRTQCVRGVLKKSLYQECRYQRDILLRFPMVCAQDRRENDTSRHSCSKLRVRSRTHSMEVRTRSSLQQGSDNE